MPTAPARTLTVTLRWDGPRLNREQLAARAKEALARIDRQFRNVARDPQVLPSEDQQYVQVIIHLEASDAEAEHYKQALKDSFAQAAMPTMRAAPPTTRRDISAPAAFTYKSEPARASATNAAMATPDAVELQAGSWLGLFLFVVAFGLTLAVAAYALVLPYFPETMDVVRSFF